MRVQRENYRCRRRPTAEVMKTGQTARPRPRDGSVRPDMDARHRPGASEVRLSRGTERTEERTEEEGK